MTTGLLITTAGQAAIAADLAGGADLVLSHVAFGDAGGVPYLPNAAQVALVNERYRATIASVAVVEGAIVIDAIIPADTPDGSARPSHGFNVAEAGIYSAGGTLVGIARMGNGYKPPPSSGQASIATFRFKLSVANPSAITVVIDPQAQISVGRQVRPFFMVVDGVLNAPPSAPAAGATYVVGAAPTGAWSGFAHRIAQWVGVWALATVPVGHLVVDNSQTEDSTSRYLRRTSGGWTSAAATETAFGPTRLATEAEHDASSLLHAAVPGRMLITTAITKTVHGASPDFANLNDAMLWLSKRRIAQGGSVTFQLRGAASGTATQYSYGSTPVTLQHPDLQRVTIQGATMLGAAPLNANFTITGPSAGQRATDRAAALTVLRSRFATELSFTGGAGLSIIGVLGGFKDILITGDRTTGSGPNIGTLLTVVAGSCSFAGPVAVHGAGSIGFHIRSAIVAASSSIISVGCVGPNIQCDAGRLDFGSEFVALSGDNDGVSLNSGSFRASFSTNVGHARGNAGNGVGANAGGVLINGTSSGQFVLNGLSGLYSRGGGSITAPGAICTFNSFYGISTENGSIDSSNSQLNSNGQYGFYNIGGRIITTGSALGSNGTGAGVSVNGGFTNATGATSTVGLSPATGVVGNANSMNIT
jgi:hypothetical protein